MLGFGDDAPGAAPGVMRFIDELSEHADSLLRLLAYSARLGHLGVDALAEPLIPCQSEDVVDLIGLTPTHQIVSAEAGVGAQQDPHFWPARTNLLDDALDFFPAARRGICIRWPQPCAQQMIAREDVCSLSRSHATQGNRVGSRFSTMQ